VEYIEIRDLEYQDSLIRAYSGEKNNKKSDWIKSEKDQYIEPLHESDWNILFEAMLPQKLDRRFFVKKNESYKLIPGVIALKIRFINL